MNTSPPLAGEVFSLGGSIIENLIQKNLGKSGLQVSTIGFGTSALGDMPATYGYEVSEARARATVEAIFAGDINFLDTSRIYGFGQSETRIGAAIRENSGLPDGFVLATKLDRDPETGRFDGSEARRSLEASLKALGLERLHLLHLHDPEHARSLDEVEGKDGAIAELVKMKEEGLVDAIGLAMGRLDIMLPLVKAWDFDCILSHNRYTLLNRSAGELFDYAVSRGIAVLNAAPYAGGVLAKGSEAMPQITYQKTDFEGLAPVRAIEAICAKYSLPMGAVALQFSMRDPRITSTICGVSTPERVAQTLEWASAVIPEEAWGEIEKLGFETEDPEANRFYNPG